LIHICQKKKHFLIYIDTYSAYRFYQSNRSWRYTSAEWCSAIQHSTSLYSIY